MGTVEAGTCGALRMQAIGVVDGREAIVIEHVTRLAHDVAPDWPTGIGDLSYRVVDLRRARHRLHHGGQASRSRRGRYRGMTSGAGAMVATAMRVVNAVPHVVAAEPGLLSSIELPLTLPQGAFRPA